MTHRDRIAAVVACTLAMIAAQTGVPAAGQRATKRSTGLLLQIQDRQLFLGPVPYRNIGVTIPDLFARFLRGDDAGATQALADAQAVGVRFVRCACITGDGGPIAMFRSDRARWLGAFDRMLAAAAAHGISLVPSLLYEFDALPGVVDRTEGKSEGDADLLRSGSASNGLAVEYVTALVTHTVRDPRILFWEIGNEYNRDADRGEGITSDALAAFLRQIAGLIHRLDAHRLVTSGNGDLPPDAWHRREALQRQAVAGTGTKTTSPDGMEIDTLDEYRQMLALQNPPGIDILSVHQSPPGADTPHWLLPDDTRALKIPWIMYAAQQIGKPLFVGAFGQPLYAGGQQLEAPWMLDFLRRMQADGSPLSAVRSWEPAAVAPASAAAASDALSLRDTPRMAVALKTANTVIVASMAGQITFSIGPALQATDQAVQQDRLRTQTAQLHEIAVEVLAGLRVRPGERIAAGDNTTGATLRLPDSGATAFRVRDAALMAGSDFIAADELAGWIKLLAARRAGPQGLKMPDGRSVPPYSIPDHIGLDGAAGWVSGAENELPAGSVPPADSAYYFISLVRNHLRVSGRSILFKSSVVTPQGRTPLAGVCDHAFDSVAVDTKTGLVVSGVQNVPERVDWGVDDAVRKTGFLLMGSLLRYQAARDLADLYEAAGNPAQMTHYRSEAEKIKASFAEAFYLPLGQVDGQDTGLLLSATILGRKDDLWASAYAVSLGVLPQDKEIAVARHLLTVVRAGGSVQSGQVRSLPPDGPYGGVWEQCLIPAGGPENGGYSGLPVGWVATALAKVDATSAVTLVEDYLTFLRTHRAEGAPWEWTDTTHHLFIGPHAAAAVTLPYTALIAGLTTN